MHNEWHLDRYNYRGCNAFVIIMSINVFDVGVILVGLLMCCFSWNSFMRSDNLFVWQVGFLAIISQFRSPVMIRSIFVSSSFRSSVSKSFNMLILELGGRYHVTIITYWLRPRETVCFMDPRPSMFPEAKPRETSTVEGPQNILLSRGLSQ